MRRPLLTLLALALCCAAAPAAGAAAPVADLQTSSRWVKKPRIVRVGQLAVERQTVTNLGPETAPDVRLNQLWEGIYFSRVVRASGLAPPPRCLKPGPGLPFFADLTCPIGDLAPGQSVSVDVEFVAMPIGVGLEHEEPGLLEGAGSQPSGTAGPGPFPNEFGGLVSFLDADAGNDHGLSPYLTIRHWRPRCPDHGRQGDAGRDRLRADASGALLLGLAGSDRLTGDRGRDCIFGHHGADTIRAADGRRDLISCGAGRDRAFVDRRDAVRGDCEQVEKGK